MFKLPASLLLEFRAITKYNKVYSTIDQIPELATEVING